MTRGSDLDPEEELVPVAPQSSVRGDGYKVAQLLALALGLLVLAAGLDALWVTGVNLGDNGNPLFYKALPAADVAVVIAAPAISRHRLRTALVVVWALGALNIALALVGADGLY